MTERVGTENMKHIKLLIDKIAETSYKAGKRDTSATPDELKHAYSKGYIEGSTDTIKTREAFNDGYKLGLQNNENQLKDLMSQLGPQDNPTKEII